MKKIKNKLVKLFSGLILLLLIFNVYFLFFIQKPNCLTERILQKETDIRIFQKQISHFHTNEFVSILNCTLYYQKKPILLPDILKNTTVLVFRFSLFNCSACVSFALDKLQQNFHDFNTNNRIILIYDDENMRVSESMFGKISYITKEKNVLGLPMENTNIPFMFILDSDMKVKHFFVPEKGMPGLTDEYLTIIKKKYFSINKSCPSLNIIK